jgi:hypothetical protein
VLVGRNEEIDSTRIQRYHEMEYEIKDTGNGIRKDKSDIEEENINHLSPLPISQLSSIRNFLRKVDAERLA